MRKPYRKPLSALLIAALAAAGGSAYAAPAPEPDATAANGQPTPISAAVEYGIRIDGKDAVNTGFFQADGGRIMLPLREVSEALGFEIEWHAESMSAELSKPDSTIRTLVQTGKDEYALADANKPLGAAPTLRGESLYVPADFFSEVLQADVSLEGVQVTVSSRTNPSGETDGAGEAPATAENGQEPGTVGQTEGSEAAGESGAVGQAEGSGAAGESGTVGQTEGSEPAGPESEVVGESGEGEETGDVSWDEFGTTTLQGVITGVQRDDGHATIHVDGAGAEGIVLRVDEKTVIRNADGQELDMGALALAQEIEAVHSLLMTLSLPPQAYAAEIVVKSEVAVQKDLLGTSGTISELQTGEDGRTRIRVKGNGMTEISPDEIILNLHSETTLIDKAGNPVEADRLTEDAKVLVFYGATLAKSMPPIGQAWKVVLMEQE